MKNKNIVIKASGEQDMYSAEKLRKSLSRSGAGEQTVNDIILAIEAKLYDGIPTKKIYHLAYDMLKKISTSHAGKYNLKRAIMELGPSGFPFEQYIGAIFEWQGYTIKTKQVLPGVCVNHEIDVLAEKSDNILLIECKYHNSPGTVSDVKVPLYIHSRFLDVLAMWNKTSPGKTLQGWVVTNTKFSSDAIKYGLCAGLKMLGWNYPQQKNLSKMVDESGLYPVTCLTTLSAKEKEKILESGIVLCKDLMKHTALMKKIFISETRIPGILSEITALCKT